MFVANLKRVWCSPRNVDVSSGQFVRRPRIQLQICPPGLMVEWSCPGEDVEGALSSRLSIPSWTLHRREDCEANTLSCYFLPIVLIVVTRSCSSHFQLTIISLYFRVFRMSHTLNNVLAPWRCREEVPPLTTAINGTPLAIFF